MWDLRVCSWKARQGGETWWGSPPGGFDVDLVDLMWTWPGSPPGCGNGNKWFVHTQNLFASSALWKDVIPTDPHCWQINPFCIGGTFWFSNNFNLHSLHYSHKIYMWKNLWLWFRLWFAPMKGLMLGFQQKEKAEQVRLRSRAKIFSNSVAAIAQLPDLLDSDLFSRCSQGCVLFGLYRGGQSQG